MKEEGIKIRVSITLKKAFQDICKIEETTMSNKINDYIYGEIIKNKYMVYPMLTWDYNEWKKYNKVYTQLDWNQTLLLKIKEASRQLYQSDSLILSNTIIVNKLVLNLLDTLEYCHKNDNGFTVAIDSEHKVIIDDTIDNKLIIFDNKSPNINKTIKIKNYRPETWKN